MTIAVVQNRSRLLALLLMGLQTALAVKIGVDEVPADASLSKVNLPSDDRTCMPFFLIASS
jgi:hypothetical protein